MTYRLLQSWHTPTLEPKTMNKALLSYFVLKIVARKDRGH